MKGRKQFQNKLRQIAGAEVVEAARKVLYVGADMIRAEAFQSISRGSVSGKHHIPSAPGQPPNRDTGTLQSHIESKMTGHLTAEVTSKADYAGFLEFGTSRMAARPYMRPARDKMAPKIQSLFAKEMASLIRKA